MINSKTKRKGVSVVISTLLVLAITVVGAMSISNLMSTSALTTVNQTPKAIIAANSVLLIGYDTRDGTALSGIATLNNEFDGKLCTFSCAGASANNPPSAGGTDFIVLQLWNKNTREIPIKSVQINGVLHPWDTSTRNVPFDGSTIPPAYPTAGKFSITHHSNVGLLIQNGTQFVADDQEKRIIVKLSPAVEGDLLSKDIGLGEPLEIIVYIEEEQPAEYVILSGDTR